MAEHKAGVSKSKKGGSMGVEWGMHKRLTSLQTVGTPKCKDWGAGAWVGLSCVVSYV